ncbi:uncharacterized protein LOC120827520 isoform X2 [Gasterosteus aculeatus]
MSVERAALSLEGFLEKRKDTMKLRWVTYWFRLQNTTLFFYTQTNGIASDLRGCYYIFKVQSVREVHTVHSKRFVFEITMTDGKRKVLAAQTAALRKQWVERLWEAMNLSTSSLADSSSRHLDAREQRGRPSSSSCARAGPDSAMGSIPARPFSAPPARLRHLQVPAGPSEGPYREESPDRSPLPHQHPGGDSLCADDGQEGGYDVLPLRKKVCEVKAPEMDDDVYDFPLAFRRPDGRPVSEPTESIYDVPSSLLRKRPSGASAAAAGQRGLLEDMRSSLRMKEGTTASPITQCTFYPDKCDAFILFHVFSSDINISANICGVCLRPQQVGSTEVFISLVSSIQEQKQQSLTIPKTLIHTHTHTGQATVPLQLTIG